MGRGHQGNARIGLSQQARISFERLFAHRNKIPAVGQRHRGMLLTGREELPKRAFWTGLNELPQGLDNEFESIARCPRTTIYENLTTLRGPAIKLDKLFLKLIVQHRIERKLGLEAETTLKEVLPKLRGIEHGNNGSRARVCRAREKVIRRPGIESRLIILNQVYKRIHLKVAAREMDTVFRLIAVSRPPGRSNEPIASRNGNISGITRRRVHDTEVRISLGTKFI